jgi:hypothetical protein
MPPISKRLFIHTLSLTTALLAACAAAVPTQPVIDFVPRAESVGAPQAIRMHQSVTLKLTTGYSRTLAANSVWRVVGRIAQGDIYRPVDSVFTLEGRDVHEAYLVLSGAMLVGFYLPGESNYSPLSTPVTLPIAEEKQ